jgi:hypothetical protein
MKGNKLRLIAALFTVSISASANTIAQFDKMPGKKKTAMLLN